ncbi:M48 family metalloprotease [Sneathiella sp.]|uniref:M48 family metalloprotease n=1 Tax=Sneathiella sp. TaxID=1964365 RepID=UPI0039E53331
MIKRILISFLAIVFATLPSVRAYAQQTKLSYIRDAEIEHTLRSYASPLFTTAGLNANDVSIHLINNKTLNAFVAGGQRMFFFTGLLERVEHPSQLKGVIAHETGHIAGGHLARTQEALEKATTASIIGYLLGAAAIIAGGGAGGQGIIMGSQALATKNFLKYNRTQESSADQAAMAYLNQVGVSGVGMLEFLRILGESDRANYGKIDPYWRSHPISSERIQALEQQVNNSPFKDVKDPPHEVAALKRIQGKLFGFTNSLAKTLKKYPLEDQSVEARYARAVGYFRRPDIAKATVEIDSLIAEFPGNPYFYELKGQMLYENGDVFGALPSLEAAVETAPFEPLILTLYGRVLLASGRREDDLKAVEVLRTSVSYDPNNSESWHQLATGYSRIGDTGNLALATAERFLLIGKFDKAIFHAKRAQENLGTGTPGFLRADDIITIAAQLESRR